MNSLQTWIRGLISAFVGGGAGSLTSGFVVSMVDPAKFNTHGGLHALLEVMASMFVSTGVIHAAGFLQQSPLPQSTVTVTAAAPVQVQSTGDPKVTVHTTEETKP